MLSMKPPLITDILYIIIIICMLKNSGQPVPLPSFIKNHTLAAPKKPCPLPLATKPS